MIIDPRNYRGLEKYHSKTNLDPQHLWGDEDKGNWRMGEWGILLR
jgi:hypothetical protein